MWAMVRASTSRRPHISMWVAVGTRHCATEARFYLPTHDLRPAQSPTADPSALLAAFRDGYHRDVRLQDATGYATLVSGAAGVLLCHHRLRVPNHGATNSCSAADSAAHNPANAASNTSSNGAAAIATDPASRPDASG